MQTYLVYEPPNPPKELIKRAERMVFVREGFSWMAALFTPLWLLFNRMWLALLLYVIAMVALSVAFVAADLEQQWLTIASLAVHLAIGFEAGSLAGGAWNAAVGACWGPSSGHLCSNASAASSKLGWAKALGKTENRCAWQGPRSRPRRNRLGPS